MKDEYVSKAITNKITATSRASVKIRDSYYTVEFSEERIIPDLPDIDIDTEKQLLWDAVNQEVDIQVHEILEASRNK